MNDWCKLCELPVDPYASNTWKQVVGFVGGPKKDSMRLREDTGFFAHDECVKKLSEGQAVDQPSLFEEPEGNTVTSGKVKLPEELFHDE